MHHKLFAAAVTAGFLLFLPGPAAADCCGEKSTPCCQQTSTCCETKGHVHQVSAIDMLLDMDPQLNPAPPVRQVVDVWFMRPTFIGRSMVQGHYLIEHDNDRMARGEPCTHVYAFDDREKPVATFHCTHLERDRPAKNVVVLETLADGMQKLVEFQFAGEHAAHGYPSGR